MPDEIVQQPTPSLRDTISANLDAAEAGTLETPEQVRARDEAGRFVKQEEPKVEKVEPEQKPAPQAQQQPQPAQQVSPLPGMSITTWRKEFLPLQQKLANGEPLTPDEAKKLAAYNVQRENEYKTGVSTYKAEAVQARELQEAVTPFLQELRANNLTPASWIKQVGQINQVLMRGTPEQKLGVIAHLAQVYGVPIGALSGSRVDPTVQQVMAMNQELKRELSALKGEVSGVAGWKQQLETQALEGEIASMAADTANYPHFDAVRERMAQLLETGAARDLPTAYKTAVRENDELYEQDVTQRLAQQQSQKTTTAAQARSRAVSPKSATPSGQVKTTGAKDRRSVLSDAFDAHDGGRV